MSEIEFSFRSFLVPNVFKGGDYEVFLKMKGGRLNAKSYGSRGHLDIS